MTLRVPKLYNLRSDPFERADESMDYAHWRVDHVFALVPAQAFVGQWLSSFKDFPPRQKHCRCFSCIDGRQDRTRQVCSVAAQCSARVSVLMQFDRCLTVTALGGDIGSGSSSIDDGTSPSRTGPKWQMLALTTFRVRFCWMGGGTVRSIKSGLHFCFPGGVLGFAGAGRRPRRCPR